jgi:Xaa-Pro aminopeptidase
MRIKNFTESIEGAGLDAYLVMREANIIYYASTISGGILVVSPEADPILLAPRLNLTIAQDQAIGFEVKPYTKQNVLEQIADILNEFNPTTIGFDEFSLELHQGLEKRLRDAELKTAPDLVWEMRRVKDIKEQRLMRRAAELADIGMEAIRQFLVDGVREYEVAAEASYAMRREGADEIAFPFIIASGPRSAYPHAGVTDRRIRQGDFVTVDMGATYREYRSDITRTFILGAPSTKQRAIYETVLEANEAALPEIQDGAAGVEVDRVARDIIEREGYGDSFIHGLGHGVGIEVHEPPSLSKTSDDTLRAGNVVTDEPGIYIPDFGGVRIEDTVLVTESGPELLTKYEKAIDAMRV